MHTTRLATLVRSAARPAALCLLLCAPAASAQQAQDKDKARAEGTALVSADYSSTDEAIRAAMAGAHRKPGRAARDYFRHPFETLTFFGLQRNHKVIELSPGGGWYTEILAPILHKQGQLRVTVRAPKPGATGEEANIGKEYAEFLAARPEIYGKVQTLPIDPKVKIDLGSPGSADMVLTFRNLHNWNEGGYLDAMIAAAFKTLKKGGVFGVVEHRARPDARPEDGNKSGYLPEAWVIKKFEAAGFKLKDKSEINANPKDTKDYKEGVWTLPPNFALGAKDREKYVAIGESDRMTLKFVKP